MAIRYYYKGSKILFVGINPHFGSDLRGVPFSNNKMFWYLLSRSGIILEKPEYLRDDLNLQKFYREKFHQFYNLGLVNIIDRPTRDVSELKKGEEKKGVKRLKLIIEKYTPKIVVFVGKITFEKFSEISNFSFGWQKNFGKSKIFVMHFPLRGPANLRIKELREIRKFSNV